MSETMNRRDVIRRIVVTLGGTISAPTLAGLVAGCRAPSDERYTPRSLSVAQSRLVGIIAEHIIPTTDTPGALDARVDMFVDMMLTDFYSSTERDQFLRELEAVDKRSRTMVGTTFERATREEQIRVLEALDAEAYPEPGEDTQLRSRIVAGDPPFMRTMKELTVSGYYTSKVGQTVELRPAPFGEFQADIPFVDVGRVWA